MDNAPNAVQSPADTESWEVQRLRAARELLRSVPSCCHMLALNSGAAEVFVGLSLRADADAGGLQNSEGKHMLPRLAEHPPSRLA